MGELLHDIQHSPEANVHLCLAVEFGLYNDLVIVLTLIPTILCEIKKRDTMDTFVDLARSFILFYLTIYVINGRS